MTRFLHRPMFRRGGSTGEGITSGLNRPGYNRGRVVNPGGYAGDIDEQYKGGDFDVQTQSAVGMQPNFEQEMLRKIAGTEIKLPRSNARGNFLTNLGANILAQPGGTPFLQMLGTAAKEPLARFQSARGQEGMLKYQHAMSNRSFLLESWKAMSNEQKTAMQKNIAWLQTEEGGSLTLEEAIDRVASKFRKQMSPEEKQYKEEQTEAELDRKEIADIQNYFKDDYYLDPNDAAKYRDFKDIVDGIDGIDVRRDASVFIDRGSWTNEGGFMGAIDDDQNIVLTADNVNNFEEGYAYIDLKTGQGYYRKGNKLIKIVEDEEIISAN